MFIMLCSQIAFASSWYWVGEDTTGDQYYIDNNSVLKNYNYAVIWVKINRADGTFSVQRLKLDHMYKRCALLYYTNYDSNGNVIDSETNDYPDYEPIVPDSMGETYYYAVWRN